MVKRAGLFVLAALLIALATGTYLLKRPQPGVTVSAAPLLDSKLYDLQGTHQDFKQWRGRLLVIHFWAPWCLPCRSDIPGFITLQNRYANQGVQFIGIALADHDAVALDSKHLGIPYPVLLGDLETLSLMRKIGDPNGKLPFLLLVGADNRLIATHTGNYPLTDLEADLRQHLPAP